MKAALFSALLVSINYAQDQNCEYSFNSPNSKEPYVLNLTQIRSWTLESEQASHFYYYTPCRNGLRCTQGGALFSANAAQFKQGANQCEHFLSVDHHDRPSYSAVGDSWRFHYQGR